MPDNVKGTGKDRVEDGSRVETESPWRWSSSKGTTADISSLFIKWGFPCVKRIKNNVVTFV